MHHKFLLTLLAIFTALLAFSPMALAEESTNTAGKDVRILFTSDLHSNILPYKTTDESGKVVEVGGYARLKTLIDQNKTAASVLVDAEVIRLSLSSWAKWATMPPPLAITSLILGWRG